MNIISYTDARTTFKTLMENICDSHEPTVITRQKGKPVVMISLDDYNAMQETLHLLSTPANTRRLFESIAQLQTGLAKTATHFESNEQEKE